MTNRSGIENLFAGLAHTLNTPLGNIKLGISHCLDQDSLDSGLRDTLRLVQNSLESTIRTVENLKALTIAPDDRFAEEFDLGDVVRSACSVGSGHHAADCHDLRLVGPEPFRVRANARVFETLVCLMLESLEWPPASSEDTRTLTIGWSLPSPGRVRVEFYGFELQDGTTLGSIFSPNGIPFPSPKNHSINGLLFAYLAVVGLGGSVEFRSGGMNQGAVLAVEFPGCP